MEKGVKKKKKKKKLLSQHSAREGAGGGGRRRKPISVVSQHCIWSRMADVHAALRLDGRPGQLAPLVALPLSFHSVLLKTGPKITVRSPTNNFIKQVSQTVGQR